MKRTISLIILLVLAATLAAQPASPKQDGNSEKASKVYAVLGKNIRDGKHSAKQILTNPVINVRTEKKSKTDVQWKVNSFGMIVIVKGMEEPPIYCKGNTLSDKAKEKIEKLPSGATIFFVNIKASSKEGTRQLDEFGIHVK